MLKIGGFALNSSVKAFPLHGAVALLIRILFNVLTEPSDVFFIDQELEN